MKDRIREVRKAAGMNQTEFGIHIGATQAMLTSYETGRVIPSDATLKLISKEFGISYAWLKTGEGPMNDPTPELDIQQKLTETYHNLPDRLRSLVDALIQMDPEWYKTLDQAFDAIEKRRNSGDAG